MDNPEKTGNVGHTRIMTNKNTQVRKPNRWATRTPPKTRGEPSRPRRV